MSDVESTLFMVVIFLLMIIAGLSITATTLSACNRKVLGGRILTVVGVGLGLFIALLPFYLLHILNPI